MNERVKSYIWRHVHVIWMLHNDTLGELKKTEAYEPQLCPTVI